MSWKLLINEKPHSYITGMFDGKKSDEILVQDENGKNYVAVCYQGRLDGSEFCDFYTSEGEYEIKNVIFWMNIPLI